MKDYKDKVEYPGVFAPPAAFYDKLDYKIVNQFKSDEGIWNKEYLLKQLK